MDSITHVVVGATAGYLIAGKKNGKRAMLWGAIGGSLPDIDVISSFWLDPVSRLLAHRGFTHSILFLVCAAPLLAWLTKKFFEKNLSEIKGFRYFIAGFLFVIAGVTGILINVLLYSFDWLWLIVSLPFTVWSGLQLAKIFRNYIHKEQKAAIPEFKELWLVFGITLITHLFLDTCTTYGTGLLEPFSKVRIALNNISVADIFFTIPSCVFLVLACVLSNPIKFARINMIWMASYFVLTFFNYHHMERVFRESLQAQNIPVKKMMISPSILNNFLWYAVAESDSSFVNGQISLFDEKNKPAKFYSMAKSYDLIPAEARGRDLDILHSFSQGYYNLCLDKHGNVQWNDLRFGVMGESAKNAGDYVFKFTLKNEDGVYRGFQSEEMNQSIAEMWGVYWQRVWGNQNSLK